MNFKNEYIDKITFTRIISSFNLILYVNAISVDSSKIGSFIKTYFFFVTKF